MPQDTWCQHEVSRFDLFDQIRDLVCFSKRQITVAQHIIILADVGADGNTKFSDTDGICQKALLDQGSTIILEGNGQKIKILADGLHGRQVGNAVGFL